MISKQIKQIKELISTSDKWCKGVYAKNKAGRDCLVSDKKACSFCLSGAAQAIKDKMTLWHILTKEVKLLGYFDIVSYNDDPKTTHSDVMNFLDMVAKKYEKTN